MSAPPCCAAEPSVVNDSHSSANGAGHKRSGEGASESESAAKRAKDDAEVCDGNGVRVPPSYNRASVCLYFADALKAIDWYSLVFKTNMRKCFKSADGKSVLHAELQLGDVVLMLSDMALPQVKTTFPVPTTAHLYVYVANVDACYSEAVKAGASGIAAPSDQFYGDRMGTFQDPFGNQWSIAQPGQQKSDEEVQKAALAMQSADEEKKVTGKRNGKEEDNNMAVEAHAAAEAEFEKILPAAELSVWKKMNSAHHGDPKNHKPHEIVSGSEWFNRMRSFLSLEKALTRHRDYVTSLRQRLPWTEVSTSYEFDDLHGKRVSLLDLFAHDKDDLFVYHMMLPFTPTDERCCPACSYWVDSLNGVQWDLEQKINIAVIAKGTPDLIIKQVKRSHWDQLPLFSSARNSFGEDMGTVLTAAEYQQFSNLIDECGGDKVKALSKLRVINPNHPNVKFNFGDGFAMLFPVLSPGFSVFHLDRSTKKVYRTYAAFQRGTETMNAGLQILDFMPFGREDHWPAFRK